MVARLRRSFGRGGAGRRLPKPFDAFNALLLGIIGFAVLYPLVYTISVSLSDPLAVMKGQVRLLPINLSLSAYGAVFQSSKLWKAYLNTVTYTSLGTVIRLVLLVLGAYPLSRQRMPFRSVFLFMIGFTLLFDGGIVPTFLVVKATGLLNTIWAMIIPSAISAFHLIVVRTFFQSTIPQELEDSASIDGANDLQVLFRIVLPLSAPIVAVMAVFVAVEIWNNYFQALIYLSDDTKWPLTVILRAIVVRTEVDSIMDTQQILEDRIPPKSIQAATLIVSVVPIMLLYPLLQRYFVKGIMIGAVKG